MKLVNSSKNFQILLQLGADIIAIWLGFAIQLYIRFFSGLIDTFVVPTYIDYISGSFLMTFFWITMFWIFGMYKDWYVCSPFTEFYSIIKVSLFTCFIIVLLIFTSNDIASFRVLFLVYFCISVFLFTFFRFIIRRIQIKLRRESIIKIPTLIVGKLKPSIEFYIDTLKSKTWGYDIKGIILYENEKLNDEDKQHFVVKMHDVKFYTGKHPFESIGTMSEYYRAEADFDEALAWLIRGTKNDINDTIEHILPKEIVLSSGTPDSKSLFEIEDICIKNNIKLSIFPNLYDHFTGRTKTQNLYGIPLIEVSFRLVKPIQYAIKRAFDIVFSLSVLILGLPVWIIVAIIIRLESVGSAIYTQPRVGKNNKIFTIYKFRSMVQNKDNKQQWATSNDPRVTKFGRFIRKTHIDEMPQFFNILKGDMSVVGPRPEQPKFVEEFSKHLYFYNRRHLVRPGLTGWNQILRPIYDLNLEEVKIRTKNDFYYIENFSLQLDFEIIVRTVWKVLLLKGQA